MNSKKAVVFGLSGTELTGEERDFFKDVKPAGFILFARNISDKEQVKMLTASLRECAEDEKIMIMIDEEGGRVRRFRPPLCRDYTAARNIGKLAEVNYPEASRFAYLNGLMMGRDLLSFGVNVDCAPVLDLLFDNADNVIGDRAFSKDPKVVKWISKDFALGLIHAGVTPVIKHIPGHGRSLADTHKDIVHVDATLEEMKNTDFVPFKCFPYPVFAMMSHIIYTGIDAENPATMSAKVRKIIKEEMDFDGIIFSDDFSMGALGNFDSDMRHAAEKALFSGAVDIILHCNGKMEEMKNIADVIPALTKEKQKIINTTMAVKKENMSDIAMVSAEYEEKYGKFFA